MGTAISVIFVLLYVIMERKTHRLAKRSIRWAAILLLLLSFAVWYINDLADNAFRPIQWMIQMLDLLVPPNI